MRKLLFSLMLAMGMSLSGVAQAQIETVDPNVVMDQDLQGAPRTPPPPVPTTVPPATVDPSVMQDGVPTDDPYADARSPYGQPYGGQGSGTAAAPGVQQGDIGQTYEEKDLIGAAEGVFGEGAEGLAGIIENILKDQGRPSAYIAGREAGGAFVVGLRYGSGTMSHKVLGQSPVYWTGPSVGFDVGGDAAKVFVLVYNLAEQKELYKRFPAAEGRVYFVGGFSGSYLRRGDTVLIPIRLGVGWRLGANIGYMKFSEKQRWLPF
ncbi:EipA family protein [Sphingomonas sp. CJ99]